MSVENVLNWVADTFARTDIIDLYFIISDLVDIPISEAEAAQSAHYDAFASATTGAKSAQQIADEKGVPLGKLVL